MAALVFSVFYTYIGLFLRLEEEKAMGRDMLEVERVKVEEWGG